MMDRVATRRVTMWLGLTEGAYQYLFAGPQSVFGDRTIGYYHM